MANTFTNSVVSGIGTSPTSAYTCPALTTTTIIGMSVANTLTVGTSILVDIKLFKNGGTPSAYIVRQAEVPLGGALVAVGGDQKIVLKPGDYIQVTSNEATSVDAITSVLEIT